MAPPPRLRRPRGRSPAADLRPGHGRSTGRPIADDYRVENFTLDLLVLLDELDLDEPIDFMGSSLGCHVALRAAIAAPGRFRRLVLIIPPVAWEEGPDQTNTGVRVDGLIRPPGILLVLRERVKRCVDWVSWKPPSWTCSGTPENR
ncbi:alpha/beta fold hydrolase [Lentzea sp. DG1S-22]|uniref:alpha/beta fold hydrolase n=1 Tax=Lentzea sp. DG1S-22 TaxID=3108822 RepID=UPI003FA55513